MAGNPFISLVSAKTGLSPAVLNAWVRAEGGPAGNPLNIGPGRNYGSPEAAANATAQLLLGSHYYRGILAARGNPAATIAAIKASPWDAAHYSNGVLDRTAAAFGIGRYPSGAISSMAAGGTRAGPPTPSTAVSAGLDSRLAAVLDLNNQIQGLGLPSMRALVGFSAPQSPAARPTGSPRAGDPVLGGTSIGGLHQTEGLAGYPAHDFFAPSGSTTVAPTTGRVIKLSGHDPSMGPVQGPHGPLGWSVYIQGADGRTYYLTHLGSRTVRLGQTVRAGQPIGTVADYARYGTPSHIHMGVH